MSTGKDNRFALCRMTAKAARALHRSGDRIEDTIKKCLKLCREGPSDSKGGDGGSGRAQPHKTYAD